MFPLIPALILLLLQGQLPLERGRMPATFEGLQWAIVAKQLEADPKGASKPRIAQVCALLRLFAPSQEIGTPETDASTEPAPAPIAPPIARMSAGFEDDQRSRDGPFDLI